MKSYVELVDGWKRHEEDRAHFHIPAAADVAHLKVGDYVKIGVQWPLPAANPLAARWGPKEFGGERFWVRITKIGDESLEGTVDQADMLMGLTHGVRDDDPITFERRHILSILPARA